MTKHEKIANLYKKYEISGILYMYNSYSIIVPKTIHKNISNNMIYGDKISTRKLDEYMQSKTYDNKYMVTKKTLKKFNDEQKCVGIPYKERYITLGVSEVCLSIKLLLNIMDVVGNTIFIENIISDNMLRPVMIYGDNGKAVLANYLVRNINKEYTI